MKYRHKKTGDLYVHLAFGVDCTNIRDGVAVIVYAPDDTDHTVLVRDQSEFEENYEVVQADEQD